MKGICSIILLTVTLLWSRGQELTYDSFIRHVNVLEKEGEFREAMEYLLAGRSCFPDQWFSLSREEIYLNEKMDRYVENMELFRQGHRKGFFYFLHPALPAYKPYLELPGFDSLVLEDNSLKAEAIEHSTTRYYVCLPPDFDSGDNYPLIFFFHGGNSNFSRLKKHWKHRDLEKGFIRVYLQSYKHTDSESFTWRAGDERSDRDIQRIYSELGQMYGLDSTRVFVAGMSAGATYAIDLSLRRVIPVSRIVAFSPGMPRELAFMLDYSTLNKNLKAYVLGGEFDFCLLHQEKLCEVFDHMGLLYKHVVVEQMSHQYPDNEEFYIGDALNFLQ